VLGDHDYGCRFWLRERLAQAGCEYVLSVRLEMRVFEHGTAFVVGPGTTKKGLARQRPLPDREPQPPGELIARLGPGGAQTVTFRDGPDGEPVTSTFVFARVHASYGWQSPCEDQRGKHHGPEWRTDAELPPREEWLIAEWPQGEDKLTGYWISNLPADTDPERLAYLARLRWEDRARLQAAQRRART
jgi:hypothetical protein